MDELKLVFHIDQDDEEEELYLSFGVLINQEELFGSKLLNR
jgi:hypothetical protein